MVHTKKYNSCLTAWKNHGAHFTESEKQLGALNCQEDKNDLKNIPVKGKYGFDACRYTSLAINVHLNIVLAHFSPPFSSMLF